MVAYLASGKDVPREVKDVLQEAMESATESVPAMNRKIYVCPDVSGSMGSPVTGYRKGSSSVVRCIDVAALITVCIMRKNSDAEVLPFENKVVSVDINSRDSIMTNAQKLAAIGGGGTNCSAPISVLNRKKAKGDLVFLISHNLVTPISVSRPANACGTTWRKGERFPALKRSAFSFTIVGCRTGMSVHTLAIQKKRCYS